MSAVTSKANSRSCSRPLMHPSQLHYCHLDVSRRSRNMWLTQCLKWLHRHTCAQRHSGSIKMNMQKERQADKTRQESCRAMQTHRRAPSDKILMLGIVCNLANLPGPASWPTRACVTLPLTCPAPCPQFTASLLQLREAL